MNYLLHNNQIIAESEITFGINNRGFLYGDGLFETIIIKDNNIRNFTDHIERFKAGLKAVHLHNINIDFARLADNIFKLKSMNSITGDARLKLIAWRHPGGLFTAEFESGDYILTIQKHTEASIIKEKVVFSTDIKNVFTTISSYKTLSSLPYIIAGHEKKEKGADDIIILDIHDHISESLTANIFWFKDNKLYTPSIETGCVKGIMRKQVIAAASKLGIQMYEGLYTQKDLLSADLIFTSNAAGLDVIKTIEGKEFNIQSDILGHIRKEVL